jgi:hypothetical protein
MTLYFQHGNTPNEIRHPGIPAMRSATLESLQKLPEAVTNWLKLIKHKAHEEGPCSDYTQISQNQTQEI